MAINKPEKITFHNIKHIIIDIVLVSYFIFRSVNVQNTDKTAISHLVCTQIKFCRCEYRGDYSAVFCVFGPLFCRVLCVRTFILPFSVCSDPTELIMLSGL